MVREVANWGMEFRAKNFHVFFGFSSTPLDRLQIKYGDYSWRDVQQVHGNAIVGPEQAQRTQADGLWDDRLHQALVIQTADCLPVMLVGKNRVCALHAGWRGLVAEILPRGVKQMLALGERPSDLLAFVGPHIGSSNFEVGRDVALQIESTFSGLPDQKDRHRLILPHSHPEKRFVDLAVLAEQQIHQAGVLPDHIHWVRECTFSSPRLHSFRRDGKGCGRNWSFVTRLD